MKLIASAIAGPSVTSITINNIPQQYDDLIVLISANSGGGTGPLTMSYNGSNNNIGNSKYVISNGDGTSTSVNNNSGIVGTIQRQSFPVVPFSPTEIYIPNYSGAIKKVATSFSASPTNNTSSSLGFFVNGAGSSISTAITSITITATFQYHQFSNISIYAVTGNSN